MISSSGSSLNNIVLSSVQFSKALALIVVTELGRVTDEIFEQKAKAESPIVVKFSKKFKF